MKSPTASLKLQKQGLPFPRRFTAEASEIGLRPGSFPHRIIFDDIAWTKRAGEMGLDGETAAYTYTHGELTLTVYND